MGFADNYNDEGGDWIKGPERDEIIASSIPLAITGVRYEAAPPGSKYADQFVCTVQLDGEERLIGFGATSVPSRARLLSALGTYFETDPAAEATPVVLEQAGQAILVKLVRDEDS
jgi:hypothetical protein